MSSIILESTKNEDGVTMKDEATDVILRLPEVLKRTGLARTTIYRKAGDGSFPPPKKLGGRAAGWYESDIVAWMKGLKDYWKAA